MYCKYSTWTNHNIELAKRFEKSILALYHVFVVLLWLPSSRFGQFIKENEQCYIDGQTNDAPFIWLDDHTFDFALPAFLGLRSGNYKAGHGSVRPGIAFRGHVYQPTEMALVMNGGTVSVPFKMCHSNTMNPADSLVFHPRIDAHRPD